MATVLELLESNKYDNPDVTESPTISDDEMMAIAYRTIWENDYVDHSAVTDKLIKF